MSEPDYTQLGKAATIVCAWRSAHGLDPDHIFFSGDGPEGFHRPTVAHVRGDFEGVVVVPVVYDDGA